MNMPSCKHCGTFDMDVFTNPEQPQLYGWPKYWIGATPNTPQDAVAYFCGSKCATKYHKDIDEVQL